MLTTRHKKWTGFFALLIVSSLIFSACSTPAPEVIEKIVTQVVTQIVKETVVQKEMVKETVIVEGTPQIVEKEVTKIVEVEKVVTATPEPEKGPTVGGRLIWILPEEPNSLDAHNTVMSAAWRVMVFVGGSLVVQAPDGNYVGFLAEDWEVSDDALTWTFYIKKGVKFHDGTELTAHDFVWTYDRARSPDATGATGTMLGSVESLEAVDDYTLQINLVEPFFPLLANLSDPGYVMVMSQEAVEEAGEEYGRHPVSVGPYRFKEWSTGEKIVLERNPDYNWGPEYAHEGPWYVEEIEFRIVPETSTQVAGLEAGELDVGNVEQKDVERIRETGLFTVYEPLQQGANPFVGLNTTFSPLDDVRVRKALNLAVDRDVLVKVVALGNAVPQYGPISPAVIGYWPGVEYIGYGYNLDKAKALLEEAGYTYNADDMLEKDGQPLKFTLKTLAGDEAMLKNAEILQEQWKALGMEIQLEQGETGTVIADMLAGNFEMTMMGIGWPEADILWMWYHSSMIGALNLARVDNPELDEILNKTRTSVDPDERQEWVNEAQRYIVEQAYMVPLYVPKTYLASSNRIQGEVFSPVNNAIYLDDAYIEAEP